MSRKSIEKTMKTFKKVALLWFVPVVVMLLLAALQHFLFDWTLSDFFALFCPVSESVWEHEKIIFYPYMFVWLILYFVYFRKSVGAKNALISASFGAILSLILTPMFYYILHGGFNVLDSLVLDIVIMAISLLLSQALSLHLIGHIKGSNFWFWLVVILDLALIAIMIVFSFVKINLPIFTI